MSTGWGAGCQSTSKRSLSRSGRYSRDEDEPPDIRASSAPARWAASRSAASMSPLGHAARAARTMPGPTATSHCASFARFKAHCLKLRSSIELTLNKMAGRGLCTWSRTALDNALRAAARQLAAVSGTPSASARASSSITIKTSALPT